MAKRSHPDTTRKDPASWYEGCWTPYRVADGDPGVTDPVSEEDRATVGRSSAARRGRSRRRAPVPVRAARRGRDRAAAGGRHAVPDALLPDLPRAAAADRHAGGGRA